MCVWYHGTYVLHIGQVSCLIYVAHILKVQSKLGLEYGQAPSDEKMRVSELRCFDHVHTWVVYALVKKSELIQVEQSKKGWGRQKRTLEEIVKYDMSIKLLIFWFFYFLRKINKLKLISPIMICHIFDFFFQLKTLVIL